MPLPGWRAQSARHPLGRSAAQEVAPVRVAHGLFAICGGAMLSFLSTARPALFDAPFRGIERPRGWGSVTSSVGVVLSARARMNVWQRSVRPHLRVVARLTPVAVDRDVGKARFSKIAASWATDGAGVLFPP